MESIEKLRYYIDHGINHRDSIIEFIDEIEREIAEKYMELPVDVDGEPIHVGDVVSLKGGEPFEVGGMRDTRSQWHVFPYDLQRWYSPLDLHHVKPDPIKELLEEYAGQRFARSNMDLDIEGLADEYAAKIREAVSANE